MTIQVGRGTLRTVITDDRMAIGVRMNDGSWFTLTSDELCALIRPADVVEAWRRRMLAMLDDKLAWTSVDAKAGVWTLCATPQQTCATWQANISDRPLRTVCVSYGQCDLGTVRHDHNSSKAEALADARKAAVEGARAWVDEAAAALLVAIGGQV